VDVAPLTEDQLDRPAGLLVERLERERAAGMPWRDGSVDVESVRSYLAQTFNGNDGRLARSDGIVSGFFQATERRTSPWPPSFWLHYLDHAARSAEVYRELYAAAAGDWVTAGCKDHYAVVPATLDDIVMAFFGLGFGLEQVHGIRSLNDVEIRKHSDAVVRRAMVEDLPRLRHLLDAIGVYQHGSPVFGLNTITIEELEEGHREVLEDATAHYWIALVDERAVGFAILEPVDPNGEPHLPERTIALNVAAVAEESRGTGIGSALTSAGLRGAAEAGFGHCITDWRSPNLTAGRTWTRWGFRPYAYRLHRTIDPRLGPAPGG
jgi:GNAT superfamily N-acetyltransferase